MEELQILESKETRNELMERIDVLEKVKQLVLLPNDLGATTQMVADYFEVEIECIQSLIKDNREELKENGFNLMKKSDIQNVLKGQLEIAIPNRGMNIFTRRAILNVAMLLRDSKIAKEIRTYLLNIEHDTREEHKEVVENIINEITEEQRLTMAIGMAYANGSIDEVMKATKALNDYKEALANKRIKTLENEKELIITNALTITDSRKIINALQRAVSAKISKETGKQFGVVSSDLWNELYKKLNYNLSINVRARVTKKESPLNHLTEDEMHELERICRSLALDNGIDINKVISLRK